MSCGCYMYHDDSNPTCPLNNQGRVGYVVLAFDIGGGMRWARTMSPTVPDNFLLPGEVGIVLQPVDIQARHAH